MICVQFSIKLFHDEINIITETIILIQQNVMRTEMIEIISDSNDSKSFVLFVNISQEIFPVIISSTSH